MKRMYINLAVLSFLILNFSCQNTGKTLEEQAALIHNNVLTVDTHSDTPISLYRAGYDLGVKHSSDRRGGRVDFLRMQDGGLDVMFFAVYLGQKERTAEANEIAKSTALGIIDSIYVAVNRYPELASLSFNPSDAYENEKLGLRSIYLGIENGYPIGRDLAMVEVFYKLGIRYITLCHSSNNEICDSSTDGEGPEYNGLSEFGEDVVEEMNRLGIMVDVSHVSDSAFYDVIKLSKAPVLATHSCARDICDHPRNMNDDMLKTLAAHNGVIQVCLVNSFVKTLEPDPARDSVFAIFREKYPNYWDLPEEEMKIAREERSSLNERFPVSLANVSDFVDHIDHIVEVAGIDHVGIGSDFDGGGGIDGCMDVSEMGNISLELFRRGYSEEDIRKIWGGNFMRVFKDVQNISSGLL